MFPAFTEGYHPAASPFPRNGEPVAALFRPAARLSLGPPRAPPDSFRRSESEPYPWFAPAVARLQSAYRPASTTPAVALHRSPQCRLPQDAPHPFRSDNGCMKVTVLLVVRTILNP